MDLTPLQFSWPEPNPEIKPDPKDPNAHYASCNRAYDKRWYYYKHLFIVHNIERDTAAIKSDQEEPPNYYCVSCETAFKSENRYRIHVKTVHNGKKTIK
jgi:hypothetical protein